MKQIMAIFGVLVLFGCKEVKTLDGQVSAEYLKEAKQLEGVYHGSFAGVTGDLRLSFNERTPQISFKSAMGDDLLSPNCQSKIGLMESFQIEDTSSPAYLDYAIFKFDAHLCSSEIAGQSLKLDFNKNGQSLRLSLLKDRKITHVDVDCTEGPRRTICTPARDEINETYLEGKFQR